jgi:transcription initiation factor TFIIE subunit alpha
LHVRTSEEEGRGRGKADSQLLFTRNGTLNTVAELFGGDATRVVDVLKGVKEITDVELTRRIETPINTVRKVHYGFCNHSLVILRRSRDKETRWFIHHWRLQPGQFLRFITTMKRRVLEKLETRLRHELNHEFYSCQTLGCKRFTFEEAIEYFFKCTMCHKPMTHLDNSLIIKILTQKIEEIKNELSK